MTYVHQDQQQPVSDAEEPIILQQCVISRIVNVITVMSGATLPKHAGRSELKKLQGNWERSSRSIALNETLLQDQNRTENLNRHSTSRRQQIRRSPNQS